MTSHQPNDIPAMVTDHLRASGWSVVCLDHIDYLCDEFVKAGEQEVGVAEDLNRVFEEVEHGCEQMFAFLWGVDKGDEAGHHLY